MKCKNCGLEYSIAMASCAPGEDLTKCPSCGAQTVDPHARCNERIEHMAKMLREKDERIIKLVADVNAAYEPNASILRAIRDAFASLTYVGLEDDRALAGYVRELGADRTKWRDIAKKAEAELAEVRAENARLRGGE